MKARNPIALTSAALLAAAFGVPAFGAIGHFEGFEDPGFDSTNSPTNLNWNNRPGGDLVRVASGHNGIDSSDGDFHAIVTNLTTGSDVFGNPSLGYNSPLTRLGGYSGVFGGGFTTSLDVYLDTAWTQGQGFDYSVAINDSTTSHKRDYMFHVGVTDLGLLVNASNNTDLNFNEGKLENNNGGNYYTVGATGWYTLQQDFYDDGGFLAVDLNLLDASGNQVWSATIASSDDINTIGGNRYGFITYNNINELAIDNTSVVPEPGSLALLSLGGLALLRRRRRNA